jgi:uncharacterized protein YutE (UPF0331/DUF86 family)
MDRQIITKRLNVMIKSLNHLRKFEAISFEEFMNNYESQLVVERLIEILVELASDINAYLLVQLYQIAPDTYADSFVKASQQGIISQDLAKELAKSAGMRNILAHQYVDIDHQIVYGAIVKALKQYTNFIQQINSFLNSLEVKNG